MISPAVFIPIAERHGLICAIGNWVIDEACRQAGVWRQSGLRMRVAINLSAYQMRQDDLVDRLQSALKANHLQAGRFTVEITESLAMENTQVTQRTFERLREAGLHVAIDDFGAGQTSLAYLRTIPASELKLDISLVRDLETSPEARTIAEALIKLAHALQRRVVAEGVETTAQRDQLVMMGCDELQGFLFARPMSARAFTIWALDDRPVSLGRFRASLFRETVQS
jgi:EAL domain-containing protein (putative c-di-GMP-specific phosphodiesterase class I)